MSYYTNVDDFVCGVFVELDNKLDIQSKYNSIISLLHSLDTPKSKGLDILIMLSFSR
ncbi:unnamed protein product, partial [Prunus brigantina]